MAMHEADPAAADRAVDARRHFVRTGPAATAAGALALLGACGGNEDSPLAGTPTPTASGTPSSAPTPTPTIQPLKDTDLLILILQLTYLQAEYYSRAVLGTTISASLVGSDAGVVTGPRMVSFKTPLLKEMFCEIAFEKVDQLTRLRSILGSAAVSRPALNLDVTDTGVFTQAARLATIVKDSETFDVYADEDLFLLGAFLIEDIITAAYKGALPLFQDNATMSACGGLLAVSACHTAMVRGQTFLRGLGAGSTLLRNAVRLSDLRDKFDSSTDLDQGVSGVDAKGVPTSAANITSADGEGLIYGRPPQLTVNVVYLTNRPATSGGFFPTGLVGAIQTSAQT